MIYLILFVAFLARVYVAPNYIYPTWDGTYYINYFVNATWQWVLHPGYPLLIQALPIGDDKVDTARIISILSGIGGVYFLYRLSLRYMSEFASLVGAALLACSPLVIHYNVLTYSESLYVLVILAGLERYSAKSYLWSGLLFGIAYLVRPEALVIAVPLLILLLVRHSRRSAIEFVALCAVVAIPYITLMSVENGSLTLTKKGMNVRAWSEDWKVNVANEGVETDESLAKVATNSLEQYPGRAYKYAGIVYDNLSIIIPAGAVAGMIMFPSPVASGLLMLVLLPFFGLNTSDRFIVPFVPFFIFFAVRWVDKADLSVVARRVIYAGFIIVTLIPYQTVSRKEEAFPEMRNAGLLMEGHGFRFLDRKPYVAFYAKGTFINLPNLPIESVVSLLREGKADFLVMSTKVIPIFRPQLTPLFDADTAKSYNLRPVTWSYDEGLVIYEYATEGK